MPESSDHSATDIIQEHLREVQILRRLFPTVRSSSNSNGQKTRQKIRFKDERRPRQKLSPNQVSLELPQRILSDIQSRSIPSSVRRRNIRVREAKRNCFVERFISSTQHLRYISRQRKSDPKSRTFPTIDFLTTPTSTTTTTQHVKALSISKTTNQRPLLKTLDNNTKPTIPPINPQQTRPLRPIPQS